MRRRGRSQVPASYRNRDGCRPAGHGARRQRERREKDGWSPIDLGQDALTPFKALLRAYPNAHTVEMSWNEPSGAMGGTSVDVLFNRMKHTITVDYSYGGGMDPEYTGRVLFTGVRESVFAAMLQAHPKGALPNDASGGHGNNSSDWGGFQYLYQRRYGCRAFIPRGGHQHRLV